MNLFDVPAGVRVRVKAKHLRWIDRRRHREVAKDITFEAITTNKYVHFQGTHRRLLINHTIPVFGAFGVWQSNKEVELLSNDQSIGRKN